MDGKEGYIKYFEKVWSKNKARGLAAQIKFEKEMQNGEFRKHKDKLIHGCWIISPKLHDSHKFRFCVFVHDELLKKTNITDPKSLFKDNGSFYAIAEYMENAGIGIIYAVPTTQSGDFNFEALYNKDYSFINWDLYFYENEEFVKKNADQFFDKWERRGVARYRKDEWDEAQLKLSYMEMDEETLSALLLNELFYTGYLKSIKKKGANDPYDVDGFIMSLSHRHIFPIEMKEKFPVLTKYDRYFGIDAGRILMLLRICIPNDSNSIYIIRQVSENNRELESWKFITLSDLIMSAGWNLQAGGVGMGGGNTQTVRIPYDEFKEINEKTFDEANLKKISDLPKEVKNVVKNYQKELVDKFY